MRARHRIIMLLSVGVHPSARQRALLQPVPRHRRRPRTFRSSLFFRLPSPCRATYVFACWQYDVSQENVAVLLDALERNLAVARAKRIPVATIRVTVDGEQKPLTIFDGECWRGPLRTRFHGARLQHPPKRTRLYGRHVSSLLIEVALCSSYVSFAQVRRSKA
jgi:hypothetical protein